MLCTVAVLLSAFVRDTPRPLVEFRGNVLFDQLRHNWYGLVPAPLQDSSGPQGAQLEPPPRLPGFRPGQRYELRIVVASSPWSRGFAPDLSIRTPEGRGGGGHHREQDFFVHDD